MSLSNSNYSATAYGGTDEQICNLKIWPGEYDYDDDPSFIDRFTLGADVVQDPETGCLVEVGGDDYYGDAATLARIYWREGMAPDDIQAAIDRSGNDLHAQLTAKLASPEVLLPGEQQTITGSARELGRLMAKRRSHFLRGGVVNRLRANLLGQLEVSEVKSCALQSDLEAVATLVTAKETKAGIVYRQGVCSKSTAESILACEAFRAALPPLTLISACPVLVEYEGNLKAISGYDRPSGIYVTGRPAEDVDLRSAVELLSDMLAEFRFVTPSDHSRALAACITPALVMGGLLPGRAPLDLAEANESQTGKGYRHKLTAAIYGEQVDTVVGPKRGAIGSLEEAFDSRLIAGRNFISIDNVRGVIDSPKFESFLTEDCYTARAAFLPNTTIDPRRIVVMLTSNKAEVTPDLVNRSSCVRILKQPDNYQFRRYPEGTILDHVRANQPCYLGAVFAIAKAWHSAGKPTTRDARHDFRAWAGILDWIVQNPLGAAPLLDGHKEAQKRMTSPELNWLRSIALAIVKEGRCSEWLKASNIIELADTADLEVPGLKAGAFLDDESTRRTCLQQTGKRLGRCFDENDEIAIDNLGVVRRTTKDDMGRDSREYMVYRIGIEETHCQF